MKLKELRAFVREQADDDVEPFLWSDDTIDMLLNDAQWEACRRARLIKDTTTDETCRLDLDNTSVIYDVHPSVIFIRRVKLNSRSQPLQMKRVRDMDEQLPGWEAHTGQLTHWVPDYTTGKIRFYRLADATTTLPDFVRLTVVRGPLQDMKPEDSPEIHPRFHLKLTYWPLYRMFSKQDAETYDPKIAADSLAAFEAEFGKPSSANEEQWIEENFDYAEDVGIY